MKPHVSRFISLLPAPMTILGLSKICDSNTTISSIGGFSYDIMHEFSEGQCDSLEELPQY